MSVTITWLLEGSPPCSWESLLGEGPTSLKTLIPLLNHWRDHLTCSSQFVGLLSSPSCPLSSVAFFLSCWSMRLICVIHTLKIGRMVWSATYYDLGINIPKSCNVRMICNVTDVVCHGMTCDCILCVLSGVTLNCFCSGCLCPIFVTLSDLWWLELWYQLYLDWDLDQSLLPQSSLWLLELDLLWWFLCALWCGPGVLESDISWGQSMRMCPYSSHS